MLDKFGSRSFRGWSLQYMTAWFERPVLWRSFLTHSLCCSHSPVNAYETPKIRLRFMYQSTPTVIFWLGKKLSNCILCLKYLTYEGGISPNRWSEYFENTTHTNSKKIGLPFVYTLKTTSVCAPFQGNDKEQINISFVWNTLPMEKAHVVPP